MTPESTVSAGAAAAPAADYFVTPTVAPPARPPLRTRIPLYREARFCFLYLAGRRPNIGFSDLYRGHFQYGDQDDARALIEREAQKLESDAFGFSLWQLPAGRFWAPPGSKPDFLFGVFAEQDRNVYGRGEFGIRAGDVVIDCGANLGAFVHKSLQAGAAKVVAVEICPDTAECLRRSFAAEIQAGKVIVYQKGMWHQQDTLELTIAPENSGENTVVMSPKGGKHGPIVPLTTLDSMCSELGLDRVDFIKMDIEGAEQNALRGARETISRFHPRMALTAYHLPEDPVRIPQLVLSAWQGYRVSCGPCEIAHRRIRPDVLYFS